MSNILHQNFYVMENVNHLQFLINSYISNLDYVIHLFSILKKKLTSF
jgi:hypothetical protein